MRLKIFQARILAIRVVGACNCPLLPIETLYIRIWRPARLRKSFKSGAGDGNRSHHGFQNINFVARLRGNGRLEIYTQTDRCTAFAGRVVGIKEVHDNIWLVSFVDYDLGNFDLIRGC
jgi:hypothetical protein